MGVIQEKMNLKKILKVVATALVITTVLGLGGEVLSHDIQMYLLGGSVIYLLWM